jgi:hypothetical protein
MHLRFMRIFGLLVLAVGLAGGVAANAQSAASTNTTLLTAPAPGPVSGVSASNTGNSGNNSFCWWVIPTYAIGDGPVNQTPACLGQINGPSAAGPVLISWPPTPGATSYRVMRTATNVFPSVGGVCPLCSIATTSNTAFSDTGATGTNYTPSTIPPVSYTLAMDNLTGSSPVVRTTLAGVSYLQPQLAAAAAIGNCVQVSALGILSTTNGACGGGGTGDVVGPASSVSGNFAQFNGATGKLLADSGKAAPTGNIMGTGQSNTITTGTQDYTAATAFLVRTGAGYAPTTTAHFGMDTTAGRLVYGFSGLTRTGATQGAAATNGSCAQYDANGAITAAAGGACGTVTGSGLTSGLPVIGGGGAAVSIGTRSGNTTQYVTTTGAQTANTCVQIDANGNYVSTGSVCATGSGNTTVTQPFATSDSGVSYWGPVYTMRRPNDFGAFTWTNQGGASVVTTNSAFYFSFPQAPATADLRSYTAALPGGTAWTIEIAYTIIAPKTNNQYCGVGLRETATNKTVMVNTQAQTTVEVANYTNDTTRTSTSYSRDWGSLNNTVIWVRIVRAGATLTYSLGNSPNSYQQLFTGATTVFFTTAPDRFGISCDVNNGNNGAVVMALLSATAA